SEIIYDRAGKCLNDGSNCAITCDCNRWWELWNNVFMQYDRGADGALTPLPSAGVDTGMGFERLVTVVQDVESNYDTDLFLPLFEEIERITGIGYAEASDQQRIAMRILADHSRAAAFLIADGIRPSNEGRGYVLRRILRRAIYYARTRLIWNAEYLDSLVRTVGGVMSDAYPVLLREAATMIGLVETEEQGFSDTLGRGRAAVIDLGEFARSLHENLEAAAERSDVRFNLAASNRSLGSLYTSSRLPEPIKTPFLRPYENILGDKRWASKDLLRQASLLTPTLTGETAFLLWDTFGVPPELTAEVAKDNGLAVEMMGFDDLLEEQRRRGREARAQEQDEALLAAARDLDATRFLGYEALTAEGSIALLFTSDGPAQTVTEGQDIEIVLEATPFYAEAGGQAGDRGRIVGSDGEAEIDDVRRVAHGVFVHTGRVVRGQLAEGDAVSAEVDEASRRAIMRNHTATHLLHRALRNVLGEQAKQAGSLVAPDRLRFDFMHNKALTEDELRETERIVREQIVLNQSVSTNVMPLQDALDMNADAMFDEKYGEEARVVSVGGPEDHDAPFSRELCGGTHCQATGEIGAFFITDQRSVGAGVRRVEAVTGLAAFDWIDARRHVADQLSRQYNVPVAELPGRIQALQERADEQPRQAASNLPDPAQLIERAESSRGKDNGALLIVDKVDAADAESLRAFGDELRERATSAAIVLGAVLDGKPSIVIMLTPDQVDAGLHAGKLAKQLGKEMGAGGGGRPDTATAGGREPASLDAALAKAKELLRLAASGGG
ncbi:MAG: hypothetical protein IIC90_10930, partial [Chloroflexi bacterium]|nr:hypothetical protein [Chloroflexota bacterium]